MNDWFLCDDSSEILDDVRKANMLQSTFITANLFSEKGNRPGADGEDSLPDGYHRERLFWVAVHRPQPRQPLAGPHKASQEAGQK